MDTSRLVSTLLFHAEKAVSTISNNNYQVKYQIKLCYSVLNHHY